jgi:uracil-DNA glycosylase family 4
VVGLAPGLGGANRTGRPFTGDASGEWLWSALHRNGFASAPTSAGNGDGLVLTDASVTNAVKCVPPANKPTAAEIATCQRHLAADAAAGGNVRVVVALGKVAHDAWIALTAPGARRADHLFAHGALHRIDGTPLLLDSFHPSPLNTRTGRLSRAQWNALWRRAARYARAEPFPLRAPREGLREEAKPVRWWVYVLRCDDGTLYTGVTTDLKRRHAQHAAGKGARYTRSRGVRDFLWTEPADSKSAALKREHAIKQLTRKEKLALPRGTERERQRER